MKCRYCGNRIVWRETHGWLLADDEHKFGIYYTEACDNRPEIDGGSAAGHWLLEEGN